MKLPAAFDDFDLVEIYFFASAIDSGLAVNVLTSPAKRKYIFSL